MKHYPIPIFNHLAIIASLIPIVILIFYSHLLHNQSWANFSIKSNWNLYPSSFQDLPSPSKRLCKHFYTSLCSSTVWLLPSSTNFGQFQLTVFIFGGIFFIFYYYVLFPLFAHCKTEMSSMLSDIPLPHFLNDELLLSA